MIIILLLLLLYYYYYYIPISPIFPQTVLALRGSHFSSRVMSCGRLCAFRDYAQRFFKHDLASRQAYNYLQYKVHSLQIEVSFCASVWKPSGETKQNKSDFPHFPFFLIFPIFLFFLFFLQLGSSDPTDRYCTLSRSGPTGPVRRSYPIRKKPRPKARAQSQKK